MSKPKVATDWLAACAGCHMSLLDMDERIVALLEKVELTSTPITDLKHPPVEGVAVGVLTGAVNNTTNVAVARMMRKRCKCLVALGDCAMMGGIVNMRNSFDMQEALNRAYIETESTVDGKIPMSPELGAADQVASGQRGRRCRRLRPRLSALGRRDLLRPERTGRRPHARGQGREFEIRLMLHVIC